MTLEKTGSLWSRGLHHASDLLIRRGTAMGPLVPTLFLVPLFLTAAYLFNGAPIVSGLFALAAIGIVFEYHRQYSKFANSDPDRLQSEEFRHEMTRIQLVAGKELATPVPMNELNLSEPTSNPENPMPTLEAVISYQGDGKGAGA